MAVDRSSRRSATPGGTAPLREEELENSGGWVKSEPVDLIEGAPEGSSNEDAFSPEIPDIREETFLTEEEESLLDAVDSEDELKPGPSDGVEVDFSADDLAAPAAETPVDDVDIPSRESFEEIEPFAEETTAEETTAEETTAEEDSAAEEESGAPLSPLEDLEDFSVPEAEELPDIELLSGDASSEPSEALPEPAEAAIAEDGSEEISLESFGLSDDAPEPPRERAARPAHGGGDEEVSLDDFLDDSGFGKEAAEEAARQEALSQEPIDLDLEFDDEAEFETLSLSKDVDEDFIEAKPVREAPKDEERPAAESSIETEEVTDFDDILSEDSTGPEALQFASERSGTEGIDLDTGLLDSGLVEDAVVEDQTALVADADSLGIEIDESARSEGPAIGRFEASQETEDLLAGVDFSEPMAYDGASAVEEISEAAESPSLAGEAEFGAEDSSAEIQGSFDDLAAVESELSDAESELADEEDEVPNPKGGAEVSASLLHQIAGELSDIKRELSSLKDQLSAIRREAPAAKQPGAAEDASKAPGFFDDEEDETIALTGDELDNILNTAQFSEETGASEDESAASAPQEESLEDIIPLEEEAAPPVAEVEDDKGFSDLMAIEEEGLSPMTEAPDDTSYLEEPLKDELEGAVLPETPLEEPDLSEFLVDESPAEPEAPVIDGGDLLVELPGEAEGELEDITLDLNPDASIDPEGLPEAPPVQVVEDMPDRAPGKSGKESPEALKGDIKSVLQYMDRLLESLPEDKIEEFARSDHFAVYKRLFEELGLV